jgi:hypothetical protein
MSEDSPNIPSDEGNEHEEYSNVARPAIWHSKDSDIPISVIESYHTHSGKEYLKIEGSGIAVPAEEVEYVGPSEEQPSYTQALWRKSESEPSVPVVLLSGHLQTYLGEKYWARLPDGTEDWLSAEEIDLNPESAPRQESKAAGSEIDQAEELDLNEARQVIDNTVEFLDNRQKKALNDKESGKPGDYDSEIARYEALKVEVQTGDFGNTIRFLREFLKVVSKSAERLIDKEDERSQRQLRRIYTLYDKAESVVRTLSATEKEVVADAIENSPGNSTEYKQPSEQKEADSKSPWKDPVESARLDEEEREASPYKFKPGEIVKYVVDGKLETDWKVVGYPEKLTPDIYVRIVKNGEERWPKEDALWRMQSLEEDKDAAAQEELVKKYSGEPVKVLLDDGRVIEGSFAGISTQDDSVYLEYKEGASDKRMKVNSKQFEAWQTLKTEEELDAEEATAKKEAKKEIWDKVHPFEFGTEVVVRRYYGDREGERVRCVDCIEENGELYIVLEYTDGSKKEVLYELLKLMQEDVEEDEDWALAPEDDLRATTEDLEEPKKRSKRVFEKLNRMKKSAAFPARVMLGDKVVDFPGNVRKASQKAYAKAGAGTYLALAKWFDAENASEQERLKKKYRRRIYTVIGIGAIVAADYFWHEPYHSRLLKPPEDSSNLLPPFLR